MESESEKTAKLLKTLKSSRPVFINKDAITDEVIRLIEKERTRITVPEMIYDFLFGWVYVGWMRRIMIAVSVGLIMVIGYQQVIILKRIDTLSGKTFIEKGAVKTRLPGQLFVTLNRYKLLGKKPSAGEINVSEQEIEKFINSLNDLQLRYRDLFELIENDPDLKRYVEERINKSEITKPNI